MKLKPSLNIKTKFYTSQKNTYGTMCGPEPEGTCVMCTNGEEGCWSFDNSLKTCYVYTLIKIRPKLKAALIHNTQVLKGCKTKDKMVEVLAEEFERFNKKENKIGNKEKYYRLLWSGDIFSKEYAEAIAEAVSKYPDIKFWIYTRSLFAVPLLKNIDNLIVFISSDPINLYNCLKIYLENDGNNDNNIRISYMSKTNNFSENVEKLSKIDNSLNVVKDLNLVPCPVDSSIIDINMGCSRCRQCISSRKLHIWFKT